jgi:hypothetical protein
MGTAPARDWTGWHVHVREAFLQQPGLRLTRAQASRLWDLDERSCARVLDSLVDTRFLSRAADGRYFRSDQPLSYD